MPEAAIDVDKESDLRLASEILAAREGDQGLSSAVTASRSPELRRAKPGEDLYVVEHEEVQRLPGGVRAKDSPDVANKVDPVGPKRRERLALPESERR